MLRVLFVCSGPTMYYTSYTYEFNNDEDMRKSLPIDIYDYIMRNNLIKYETLSDDNSDDSNSDSDESDDSNNPSDSEISNEYLVLDRDSLPMEYLKRLIKESGEIERRDLDNYREYIIRKLKSLYPDLSHIDYVSVDPITLDPKLYGDDIIMELIDEEDNKYLYTYGVSMKFINHYTMIFQEFIEKNNEPFDVIWFLQCTDFSRVISKSKSYIDNFKKNLKPGGLIIHMDWDGISKKKDECGWEQPVGKITPIDKRFNILPSCFVTDKDRNKISWFLNQVIEISPGIYKFSTF